MRRSSSWAIEQVSNPTLQDVVGEQADRVADGFGFEELVHFRIGESRVTPEIDARFPVPR
jgi:hypothetical protein